MAMPENELDLQQEIKRLLQENQALLKDNNELLHKIRRSALWATAFRVVWFAVIIGSPLALYYFFLEPNLTSLQSAFEILLQGAKDLTGLRQVFGVPAGR